ncbi:MAG: phosphate ABC transporter substrate-binding protein [Fimbriimonadaceae bacterium]
MQVGLRAVWVSVAVWTVLSGSPAAHAQRQVSVRGSDTMLPLLERWRDAYGRESGRTASVAGGGSASGIAALLSGSATAASVSGPLSPADRDRARSRGVVLHETPVALDALAIVVRADNPIESIRLDTLAQIYAGRLTDWSQIGGKAGPILPVARGEGSGCQALFLAEVLKFRRPSSAPIVAASPADVVRLVRSREGAIGYGSVALFAREPDIKVLAVAASPGDEPVPPTEAAARERRYPLWRHLNLITNGRPTGEVRRFLDFARSEEGQKIAERAGFFRLDRP